VGQGAAAELDLDHLRRAKQRRCVLTRAAGAGRLARVLSTLRSLGGDLRFSLRGLRRDPAFTLTTLALLAVGIGATASMFSVADAVVLRPLPLPQPQELMAVARGRIDDARGPGIFSWRDFHEVQRQSRSWRGGLVAFHEDGYAIGGADHPESVPGVAATANLFEVLGGSLALGRGFAPGEDQPGSNQVVVLSDGLWRRRFAGDRQVIGRSITLDGQAHTVIGVAPPGFHFPALALDAQLWTPVPHGSRDADRTARGMSFLQVWGRLAPGVTAAQAQAELDAIQARLVGQDPAGQTGRVMRAREVRASLVGHTRPALLTLLLAVSFLLLITCANVGNLMLARATVRRRELAVRSALGASRGQLVRQLLTESALLAVGGAALGLALARLSMEAIVAFLPDSLPRPNEIAVNGRVLAFSALAAVVTALLFGVAPALAASRPGLFQALRDAARGAARRSRGMRAALLVSEISLAFVLLVGAGLALRSFGRVTAVDPGFQAHDLLTAELSLPASRYPGPEQTGAFYRALLPRLQGLPGAEQAAVALPLPFAPMGVSAGVHLPDRALPPPDRRPSLGARFVSPGYTELMGIRLLRGRSFVATDEAAGAPLVALVSESAARLLWPGEVPIGKRMSAAIAGDGPGGREVVGVVADIKTRLDEPGRTEIYLPFVNVPLPHLGIVVRSPRAAALASALRAEVLAVDPLQPLAEIRTMEDRLATSVAPRRLSALLLALFAALALVLASAGIYSVLSYSVAQRTRELGIRMALGAEPRQLHRLVVSEGLRWALLGLGVGLMGALALTRVLASQLYGVSPTDATTFGALGALLLAVAAMASLVPARRATRVDPMITMRSE
jgi:putative ABC transport system permease protein